MAGALVREHIDHDFGTWAHALRLYPELYAAPILYLVNGSMFGPNHADGFAALIGRLRATDADLIGLTESHESGWHMQSYLAFRQSSLANATLQNFLATIVNLPNKQAVIDRYETKLAGLVEREGLRATALFASNHPLSATVFAWRVLIEDIFPFVKTLLFRQSSPLLDVDDWDEFPASHGFDVDLLKATLRHTNVTGVVAADTSRCWRWRRIAA